MRTAIWRWCGIRAHRCALRSFLYFFQERRAVDRCADAPPIEHGDGNPPAAREPSAACWNNSGCVTARLLNSALAGQRSRPYRPGTHHGRGLSRPPGSEYNEAGNGKVRRWRAGTHRSAPLARFSPAAPGTQRLDATIGRRGRAHCAGLVQPSAVQVAG